MRLSRITAHAFGPLRGDQLELAPGLTVVWGLNEAGKSTWHSAVGLTVTGFRRARGRPTREEQVVIDRRRPWTGSHWRVEGLLNLDNGDELIVSWDLNSRVATVHDVLGRERSNEWISDGACDLSRIVGLDRSSFMATACVRQSDLQGVREDPSLLQDLLQRAAASAAADGTASAAISRLSAYHQEHVGLNRSNSTKPLAAATRRVEQARRELEEAKRTHHERLALLEELTKRREELDELKQRLEALDTAERLAHARAVVQRRADATSELERTRTELIDLRAAAGHNKAVLDVVEAAHRVAELRQVLREVTNYQTDLRTLQQEMASMDATLQEHDRQEHVLTVARRLIELTARRDELREQLTQSEKAATELQSAVQREGALEHRLAQLELEVADRAARRSLERFRRASDLYSRYPTTTPTLIEDEELARRAHTLLDRWNDQPAGPALTGPTSADLEAELATLPEQPIGDISPAEEVLDAEREWRLALDLQHRHEASRPPVDAQLVGDISPDELRRWADVLASPADDPATVEAELQRASAAQSGPLSRLVPVLAVVAVLGLVLGLVLHPGLFVLCAAGAIGAAIGLTQRSSVESSVVASLEARLSSARSAAHQVESVRAALTQRGLPTDVTQLRATASSLESAQQNERALQKWIEVREGYESRTHAASSKLGHELAKRGITESDPDRAFSVYLTQCSARAEQAALAASRAALVERLKYRRNLEDQAAAVDLARQRLENDIHVLVADLGLLASASISEAVATIEQWSSTRSDRHAELQEATDARAELQHLLGGRTLEDLRATSAEDEEARQRCAARVLKPDDQFDLRDLSDRDLEDLETRLRAEHVDAMRESSRRQAPNLKELRSRLDEIEEHRERALQDLHGSGDGQVDVFETMTLTELDESLELSRGERSDVRQARDEAAGRLQQVETDAPDVNRQEQNLARAEEELREATVGQPEAAAQVDLEASLQELTLVRREWEEAVATADGKVKEHLGLLRAKEEALEGMPTFSEEVSSLADELASKNPAILLGFDVRSLPRAEAISELRADADKRRFTLAEVIAGMEGGLRERETNAVDPAAATEEYESARKELEQVKTLGEVLEASMALLEEAQDRVHRDIAPRLNEATNRWLPALFGARYSTVRIDPATLEVMVFSEGDPRRADLLSQGTAELFYMLLRIALVETLTAASGESCPLILDDITVNFDSERKAAALGLLQELATERQVILFTQEDEVRSWAAANLRDRDKLVVLPDRMPVSGADVLTVP